MLDMATTTSAGSSPFYVKSTASGSHLLQIDGYSIAKHAPNGTSLKSCPFMVGGYRWMLHLFPNGDGPESLGFISVYIGLYKQYFKCGRAVTLRYDFIITGYADIPENWPADRYRKCGACNLRPVRVAGMLLLHACFCEVCNDASRNDPTAKQCAGCHGPYQGRYLLL
ncbi:hypothetical protein QYE76_057819 [Lolium multiflorum]|uniref:MATH domain-containing protein n=1 Tax=Lolium multiflorum TaxID=4521 RepID=A0AAD8T5U8_LOLMU|nr:hypothetical protein QYE76_057819 [Lolium multiflorum]